MKNQLRQGNFAYPAQKMLPCLLLAAMLFFTPSASIAADPAATAMGQFKAKHYKEAALNFRKAIVAKPQDSTMYYYYALCLHYLNDLKGARATYSQILSNFPNTAVAKQAYANLLAINEANPTDSVFSTTAPTAQPRSQPVFKRQAAAPVSPPLESAMRPGSGGIVSGPDECNIHFERVNSAIVLDVMVNNRPIKMIFDTGAEGCIFGKNHFKDMSIPAPTGAATGSSSGVGDGGVQATWDVPVSLTIGPITKRNIVVGVKEEMAGAPLLGQTFFQDFTYTIDNGANNIHLRRKNKAQGSIYTQRDDPNAVPFTRAGNEIIVAAQVNGRPGQVIFDTGAQFCAFTRDQLAGLNISIPDDAKHTTVSGVAGNSSASVFPVRSLKVGPIEKRDFDIYVLEDAKMPCPLLGQTFFGDWQFTIDYENKVIHFLRR